MFMQHGWNWLSLPYYCVGAEDVEAKKGKTIFGFLLLINMVIFFFLTLLKYINQVSSMSEAV